MTGVQSRRRPLTPAEEARLARRIDRGDAGAKEEMIARNLGLVRSLAAAYRRPDVAFDDLVQEGTVGLMRAVERFDHRRGLRFSTYASWWIRRALADALDAARPIRIPAPARRQIVEIQRVGGELRALDGRPPSADDIAQRAGFGVRTVRTLQAAPRVTGSLDESAGDETAPLGELIGDDTSSAAFRSVEDRETSQRLWSMLRLLPERQREVIVRRYGLRGGVAETHDAIGARLGVGEERSRQLERQALHRLRHMAGCSQLTA
jgi:RNA polymerase primary sigma factor